jgi:hypothetical protein
MNEFEWRRQMRDLREPVSPRRDLWQRIEPALAQAAAATPGAGRPRASNVPLWLLAAGFAGVTLLAVGLGLRQDRWAAGTPLAHVRSHASAPWKPEDPRLAGAAIELDAAGMELHQAMQQSPDSPALQRLLLRTQQQQSWLRHLDRAS